MPDEPHALREQLDEVAAREAQFRLACARDFLAFEARLAEAKAVVQDLERTVIGRDTVIHERNLEIIGHRRALQAACADLEIFTWMLKDAGAAAPFTAPDLPAVEFVYFLHTSPFRLYRGDRFLLRGWLFPKDGRAVSAVRVRVDEREFSGRHGIDEPEALAQHGLQPRNPRPGFEIEFLTPPGRHWLRLEACLEGRDWASALCLPIWVLK